LGRRQDIRGALTCGTVRMARSIGIEIEPQMGGFLCE
jgi:hypothetical protein